MVRFDPTQTVHDLREALQAAAAAAWGEDDARELSGSIEQTARALWLLSQEPLEPADVEP